MLSRNGSELEVIHADGVNGGNENTFSRFAELHGKYLIWIKVTKGLEGQSERWLLHRQTSG